MKTKSHFYLICFIAFFGVHFVYLINWDYSVIQIGDNLDNMLPTIRSLVKSKCFFSFDNACVLEVYNGQVFRNSLLSSWNITSVIFFLFKDSWWAYLFNMIAINGISFFGLILILNYFDRYRNNYLIIFVALGYLLLPKYYLFGGAVYSALPLILYLYLQVIENNSLIKKILLFFVSCTVGFVIGGFGISLFLLSLHFVLLILQLVPMASVFVFFIYFAGVIFAELNIFIFKMGNFVTHRSLRVSSDFNYVKFNEFIDQLKFFIMKENFNEQTTSHIFIFLLMTIILAIYLVKLFFNKEQSPFKSIRSATAVVIFIFIPFVYVLFIVAKLGILGNYFMIFHEFDFSRISSLLPSLYWMVLGFCTIYIRQRFDHFFINIMLIFFLFLNVSHVVRNNDGYKENIKVALNRAYDNYDNQSLVSFKRYYDEESFDKIKKEYSEIKSSLVMCYGIHPGVVSYNGLNTIDFYQNIYLLDYNFKFRQFLNEHSNSDFYNQLIYWGNRLYFIDNFLYENWLFKDRVIVSGLKTIEPYFGWSALKLYGVSYVISSVEFSNLINLTQIGSYSSGEGAIKEYYIYRIL
jgi:hypothetical protein